MPRISTERKLRAQFGGAGEPIAPAKLSAAAQREWDRVTAELRQRDALARIDEAALVDYITVWSRLRECEEAISEHGVLIRSQRGGPRRNPAVPMAAEYRKALVRWCELLGLVPMARARMGMGKPAPRCFSNEELNDIFSRKPKSA